LFVAVLFALALCRYREPTKLFVDLLEQIAIGLVRDGSDYHAVRSISALGDGVQHWQVWAENRA
jgi:hypothetical protein